MLHIDRQERLYILISVGLIVVFAAAIGISSFAYGFQVPVPNQRVDPRLVATPNATAFGEPGVRELAPGVYEVRILSQMWQYLPGSVNYGREPIRVPAGAQVTFIVTSKDVQHGFKIQGTNINMMVLPGQISQLTATFDEPGEYDFVCHEFCGAAHQTMFGKIIVEE